jgi:hypothetical protein
MSNGNSNLPPGYVPITTSSLQPGTGNPRDSAIAAGQSSNAKLANLNAAVGGRRRKYRGGATSNNTTNNGKIAAPQYQMQYTPTGGPGTSPNNQIAGLTQNNMQTTAWSASDSAATKMGGRRRYRKGGSNDWLWGCYSGGKKSRRGRSRKTRKHGKKTKRQRRH